MSAPTKSHTLDTSQGLAIRYAQSTKWDAFDRNSIFVEEARGYKSVLEAGCSTGFLSCQIAANGARVVGIEVDKEAAELATQNCQRVLSCNLNSPEWVNDVGERFDLVTFGDVLEHLNNPVAVLRQTQELLNPCGRVLICLPNVAHWAIRAKLLAGNFRYESTGILDFTHLRFFTMESAKQLIAEAGYCLVWFRPIIGGKFSGRLRPIWQRLANIVPGLFSYQIMFLVEPTPGPRTKQAFTEA
ncbi:MAG TPA: class I SAM-dependent methyltransferase [Candidatus Angelobacter sp.]|jgi:2-polyprenyl-3-methyl-5-hydroxy-6-metoxy-1,4-benzoquinol methylase|nr:class I SAM-dependent methyltransferase [Candidatus Angelobacter sp.]